MDQVPPTGHASLRIRESTLLVILLLAGAGVSAWLSPKTPESFWPNFLFYWLTQALPLCGMLVLGARPELLGGSAAAFLCFLVLCSMLIDQSGG
jgi:hypothetical protein